jgi:hypothetical protein
MRTFIAEFKARYNAGNLAEERRAAALHRFVSGMTRRVSQHAAWSDASADELAAVPDALEKYATTKLYSILFQPDQSPDKESNAALFKRIESLRW